LGLSVLISESWYKRKSRRKSGTVQPCVHRGEAKNG
jgi:hypothetical protein